MKIWLLENDNRTGPHEIFDVRDRISSGELDAETPAWYDGADNWTTLDEVPAFSSYFKKTKSAEILVEEEKRTSELIESLEKELADTGETSGPDSTKFKNESLHPVRRLFARVLDMSLYTVALFIIKIQMGVNPLFMESVTKELMYQFPYLLLDAFALSYFGTTPGKWMLNIRLRTHDSQLLPFFASLIRSIRVWVLGFAMQSPLIVVSLPFSWFIASKYGKFLWDIPKNNITYCGPLTPIRIVGYILIIIVASSIMNQFVPPEFMPTLENIKAWNPAN